MELKDFKNGGKLSCTIKGVIIPEAQIVVQSDGSIFLCQNQKEGARLNDTKGYKYSWNIYHPKRKGSDMKLQSFKDQFSREEIAVSNIEFYNNIDTLLAKKKEIVATIPSTARTMDTFTIDTLKEVEYYSEKAAEDLPIFSSDLDSDSKELLKKGITRI